MNDREYYEVCITELRDFYGERPTKERAIEHFEAKIEHSLEALKHARRAIRVLKNFWPAADSRAGHQPLTF